MRKELGLHANGSWECAGNRDVIACRAWDDAVSPVTPHAELDHTCPDDVEPS